MKKLLPILIIAVLMASCQKKNSYTYSEIVEETSYITGLTSTNEGEPEIIKAVDDSTAYCMAFEKFCISQKAQDEVIKLTGSCANRTTDFKLIAEDGRDIRLTSGINDLETVESSIREKVFGIDLGNDVAAEKETPVKIDSAKIKELTPYFNVERDEFSNDGESFYVPKTAPKYVNQNAIYFYFLAMDGKAVTLRWKLQYFADEWLFIDYIKLSIDGKAFTYFPENLKRDSGNGGYIWEWFDESVKPIDKEMITALANAKEAKIKLFGTEYQKVVVVTAAQIKSMKQTLDLFHAMGGKL